MIRRYFFLILVLLMYPFGAEAAQQTWTNGESLTSVRTKIQANDTDLYSQAATKWLSGKAYIANNNIVIHGGNAFTCTANHTAGSTTEPGVGASWATVWSYTGSAQFYTKSQVDTLLSGKVGTTGDETIAGVKTFSSSPVVPTPTTDMQVATKKYVDDNSGGASAINDLSDVDTSGKATGKILKFDASGNLIVGDDEIGAAGTGDITEVTAGTGLEGGGATGAVTVSLSAANVAAIAANSAKTTFPGFTSLVDDYSFTDNSTNWNASFGWGNHASAGYYKSGDNPTFGVITYGSLSSSAADGAHYLESSNTVALSSTATVGRLAWLSDRWWLANGTNWTTRYLLDSSMFGTGSGDVAEGDHTHTGVYEPADATILKDADIGSTVQAYDADLSDLADGSLTASKVGNGYYVADDCTAVSTPATGAICDEY